MSRARVVWHYLRARRRHFPDRAALQSWQEQRVRVVLRKAPLRYRFYADLFAGTRPRSLTSLPVLDKQDVLTHFADFNSRGVSLEECLAAARSAEIGRDFGTTLRGLSVGLSSGTSGQQTAFLTSPAERDRWAGEVLARALPNGLREATRITLVLRAGGPLYESVDGGSISFRFADLALPAEQILDEIRQNDPTILVAPPSVLVMAARADLGLRLQRVFSVAEVLDPHDRATIETGFGLRVDEVYQAAEGFIGMSCSEGRLHLSEDLMVIEREPVDDGRFAPVITDLFRTSQAVLRRRLGDILVAGDGPCHCGDPRFVVDRIEGRSDDILWLARDARGTPVSLAPLFPDFVRSAVLAAPGVQDFRVIQTGPGLLQLAVEPPDAFPAAQRNLALALGRSGFTVPTIQATNIEPRDPLRKLRRVRRDPSFPVPNHQ